MRTNDGIRLIRHFGEKKIRELSRVLPGGKIPGKRFWISYNRELFKRRYMKNPEWAPMPSEIAAEYKCSIRTAYAWKTEAIKAIEGKQYENK